MNMNINSVLSVVPLVFFQLYFNGPELNFVIQPNNNGFH